MISGLSQRARVILLGTVGTVIAFFLFRGSTADSGHSREPEAAVPRDSFLVGTVNVAELRRSPLYELLFGREADPHADPEPPRALPVLSARALGIGKLADACGFDPLARVERMAIAVPEEGDKGELGVAARVTVTQDEVSKCTSALADQRGGKVATKDVGSFVVVEDSPGEGAARPRLAYGRGGLLVVGRGTWFDAMLSAADGTKPDAKAATGHAMIRSALTNKDGWRSPTILVSALLPRSLRDRLKSEMGAELSSEGKPTDGSQNVMAGVLGVSAVGAALRAGASGGTIDAAIELGCDSADACALVEKLILKKRLDWSKELTLRMVGFGPLLDSIEVKQEGPRVRVTASAAADALVATLDRVLRLRARRQEPDAPAPAIPAKKSDETIPAPRPSR